MKLQLINSSQFNQLNISRQIILHEHPQQFAILELEENLGQYGINWNDQFIQPFLKISLENQTIWIGVEQKIVTICSLQGNILLSLPLTAYLIQLITLEEFTAALTEQEILLFNPRGSIRYARSLPEVAIGMYAVDKNLMIQLIDGENLLLATDTGQLIPHDKNKDTTTLIHH